MSGRSTERLSTAPRIVGSALNCALGAQAVDVAEALAKGSTAHQDLGGANELGWPALVAAPLDWDVVHEEDDPQMRILGQHGQRMEPVCGAVRAHLSALGFARERTGLYVGMGMIDAAPSDLVTAVRASTRPDGSLDLRRFFRSGYRALHPLWPLSMLNNVAAGQLATDLDIRGDNLVLAAEATAGVGAVLEAARAVREGTLDGALAVGVSERLGPAHLARHAAVGQLHTERPGWVLGEGAAALALAGPSASSQGASSQGASILGGCTRFGADALTRAITRTLRDLAWDPQDLALVVRHATGEPRLDAAEVRAVAELGLTSSTAVVSPAKGLGDLGPAAAPTHTALASAWLTGAPLPAGTLGKTGRALVLIQDARGGAGCLALHGSAGEGGAA